MRDSRGGDISRAAPGRHSERRLFAGIVLLLVAYVGLGFWKSYFGAGLVRASLRSPLVHVHAVLFVGWLALFAVQVLLIWNGRRSLHRILRILMGGWPPSSLIIREITQSVPDNFPLFDRFRDSWRRSLGGSYPPQWS